MKIPSLVLVLCYFQLRKAAGQEHQEHQEEEIDFPAKLDADDISYFASTYDIDGLHWALSNVFARSIRNPNENEIVYHDLPQSIVARGGGSTYTSAYKLKVDIEQAQYLSTSLGNKDHSSHGSHSSHSNNDNNGNDDKRALFQKVKSIYEKIHQRIPPLSELKHTKGLYPFSKQDYQDDISKVYNRALHHTNFDELKDSNGNVLPLLNMNVNDANNDANNNVNNNNYINERTKIENQWYDPNTPPVVVIDNILTKEALHRIRQLLLESTVWYETKMPLEFGGYVGAYIDDGLHDRILIQLAFELNKALPNIMKGHALQYLWAYKYDSQYDGIKTHADQAAVNVNLWLTNDDANLDKDSGGLVVYTAKPPNDWDFASYNTDTAKVREEILEPTNFANITVPYRENRAVIFDSMLFHHTDKFHFKEGYQNRRINLTILYGTMKDNKENHQQQQQQRNEL